MFRHTQLVHWCFALVTVVVASHPVSGQDDASPAPVRYDGHKLVAVTLASEHDLESMLAISQDHWTCSLGLGVIPFRVPPQKMDALAASGLKFEILIDDIQPALDRERRRLEQRGDDFFSDFRTYAEVSDYVNTIVSLRPDIATRVTLGSAVQNRQIFGIRIAGLGDPAGRPAVMFTGTQHAREWLSPMATTYIADQLVRGYGVDARITALLDACTVHIVPIVNPDGYEYSWTTERLWRKNRRNNGGGSYGVDTNRNWGYQWGGAGSSGSSWSETYRGPFAFSEPETRAVRDYVNARPEFVGLIDFHTYSQLVLSPWGYTIGQPPEPDATVFRKLNDRIAETLAEPYGMYYEDGPAAETLYLASGILPDWSYGVHDMYSWTIEMRPNGPPGFTPEADQIYPNAVENFLAALEMADYVRTPIAIEFAGGRPTHVHPDAETAVHIELTPVLADYLDGSGRLLARMGTSGPFTPQPLALVEANLYQASLPAAACGTQIQYYVEVETTTGALVTAPYDAPLDVFSCDARPLHFADNMETDNGWTLGVPDDDATGGIWNRQNPHAQHVRGVLHQPEFDHTDGGVACYVTDGRREPAGERYSVTGGKTTLVTPAIDVSAATDPVARFWFWYSNSASGDPNADVFLIDASPDDGQTWQSLEVVGPTGTGPGWRLREFHVANTVPLTATLRLRFVASDYGGSSRIDALVDDMVVYDAACSPEPCPGDITGDGQRDLADLSAMLSAFGTCSADPGFEPGADLDGNGCIDLADLSSLLTVFGTPCA
ncbi:MAG: hypothetical protein HRF50_06845 [Phycisphaerae bacterium]